MMADSRNTPDPSNKNQKAVDALERMSKGSNQPEEPPVDLNGTPSRVKFKCSHCGEMLSSPAEDAGTLAACSRCEHLTKVPVGLK